MQPAPSIASRTPLAWWVAMLSMTTTSPGERVGSSVRPSQSRNLSEVVPPRQVAQAVSPESRAEETTVVEAGVPHGTEAEGEQRLARLGVAL